MINGFDSLRHNTIVGCNNNNGYIGYLCTTGTHSCKCFMSRGVEESYLTSVFKDDSICTDMLSNTPGLTCYYIGIPDIVQQFCFAMVNMSHHCNDWRSWLKVCLLYTSDAADEEDSVDLGG